MVLMMAMHIIPPLRMHLIQTIASSCRDAQLHSVAFALRILGENVVPQLLTRLISVSDELTYGGYPEVASIGFRIGLEHGNNDNLEAQFLDGVKRQRGRPLKALSALAADDVAILGIADGLAKISRAHDIDEIDASKKWLLELIDSLPEKRIWTSRARDLAGDLLDDRGRLRISPAFEPCSAGALEISMRDVWTQQFSQAAALSVDIYEEFFSTLLRHEPPDVGQLEEAAVWLRAIDLLTKQTSEALFPKSEHEREAFTLLSAIKAKLDARAERQAKRDIWLAVILLTAVWCTLGLLIYFLTWTVMEPWTYVIGIPITAGSYFYFAITQRELSLRGIYEQLIGSKRLRLYTEAGFESEIYGRLTQSTKALVEKRE